MISHPAPDWQENCFLEMMTQSPPHRIVTPREAYLTLDALTATYGSNRAVDATTLEIAKGELVALLGPSGCGKTTTLRMIAGFIEPSAGRVIIEGEDVTRMPAHRRNMGVVFQSYALFPHLTVLENVAFGLRMRGASGAVRKAKAGAALEQVGLSSLAMRYPSQLSGGQQQRVALARAIVIEPRVLLLDEPLSNLDAHLRAEMRLEIRQLQQRLSITTVFVTHDQQEALAMSDRVAVMSQGKLIEVGTPRELCDRPEKGFTAAFLGTRTVVHGCSSNGRFEAPGLTCADAPDGASSIVLRAARLRLRDAANGPLSLRGEVSACAFLGDSFEIDVATAAGLIRVTTPSDLEPPPLGSRCAIEALPGGFSFLN